MSEFRDGPQVRTSIRRKWIGPAIGGIFLLTQPSSGGVEIILPTPSPVPIVEVGVYITGAVQNPGICSIKIYPSL